MAPIYKVLPPRELLWRLFDYNPFDGFLYWREGKRQDLPAGALHAQYGYVTINAPASLGASYQAHRLILHWLGVDLAPAQQVDHINGDRSDNRAWNLRPCDRALNMANGEYRNKTGYRGVYRSGRYYTAQLRYAGVLHYLGQYSTPEEAHQAYTAKALEIYGNHAFAARTTQLASAD